jgi:hypothetical protein
MPALSDNAMTARAVAGRTAIDVAPLAVCALAPQRTSPRANGGPAELVEFGFRRGVSYDLMRLNPNGTAPENFLIHPFAEAGKLGSSVAFAASIVGPYLCTGRISLLQTWYGPITVARPFPLASLYPYFNGRFDQFSACRPNAAPPDANVKAYPYDGPAAWMGAAPAGQAAAAYAAGGRLLTVADPDPSPSGTTAAAYGPLWSFAPAVPYAAYRPGVAEPAAGYPGFRADEWERLYSPGQPAAGRACAGGASSTSRCWRARCRPGPRHRPPSLASGGSS